jgi:hypothetical protein
MRRDANVLQGSAFSPEHYVSLTGKFWNEISDPPQANCRAYVSDDSPPSSDISGCLETNVQ